MNKKHSDSTTLNFVNKCGWRIISNIISISLIIFLFESSIYYFLYPKIFEQPQSLYWIFIPCLTYIFCLFAKRFIKNKPNTTILIEAPNAIALIILFCNIMNNQFSDWYVKNYNVVSFIIVLIGILGIMILKTETTLKPSESTITSGKKLFNLFYLNTSKAHEIAMLIDNKIIKNIESEHIHENSAKNSSVFTFGKKDVVSSETEIYSEEMSKQRVFESFDVKQTKSVMLRKIYDTITESNVNNDKFQEGNLVLLENVELCQLNVDDTVMILNVLQDSKITNQKSDNIEINLNKMMEKMLDDFTMDYTFEYPKGTEEKQTYIIRLPYKSNANFENGYQYNDLQLGKLSIIGIYRGKIDFSQKESVSSKFLDLLSESYNNQNRDVIDCGMKLSCSGEKTKQVDFDFNHKKLEGNLNLIDVIAIIQEIIYQKGSE